MSLVSHIEDYLFYKAKELGSFLSLNSDRMVSIEFYLVKEDTHLNIEETERYFINMDVYFWDVENMIEGSRIYTLELFDGENDFLDIGFTTLKEQMLFHLQEGNKTFDNFIFLIGDKVYKFSEKNLKTL